MRDTRTEKTNRSGERGAIIIEATLTLSFFMFAMFMLLSVIQIAYAQSRISVALTSATKSIAEYTHLFYATKMNEVATGTGGVSSKIFGVMGDALSEIASAGNKVGGTAKDLGLTELGDEVNNFFEALGGLGEATSATSLTDLLKNGAGSILLEHLVDHNLGDGSEGSAERFKQRYHIKGGKLDFWGSEFTTDSTGGNHIYCQAKYEIEAVKLLNVDFSFKMSCWAYSDVWSGASS